MASSDTYIDGNLHAAYLYGDGSNLTNVPSGAVTIPSSANKAAYFNGSNQLAYETYLANTRGGIGADSSAFSGIAHITAGTWTASAIVNADVSATADIDPSKIKGTNPTYVAYYAATTGLLTSEQYLSNTRGGTGSDSSAASGIPHVATGTWTYSAIVNADISATADIATSKIKGANPDYVAYYATTTGLLTSEQYLSNTRGGTGANSSAFTGIAHISSGTWTASAIVNADVSATADIEPSKIKGANPTYVAYYAATTGLLTSEQYLATSRGGLGTSSASSTGYGYVRSGTWEFGNSPILAPNAKSAIQTKPVYIQTTDATETAIDTYDMLLTGSTNTNMSFDCLVSLVDTTNNKYGQYFIRGDANNTAGTAVASALSLNSRRVDSGLGTTAVGIVASGSDILIRVKGVAATTINWSAMITYVKQGN